MGISRLESTIESIERLLSEYYDFPMESSATNHLVSKSELIEIEPSLPTGTDDRAGVFFSQEEDEVYIGIHFDKNIREQIEKYCPLTLLDNKNLDAFTVLVEEISHFHLILHRIKNKQEISCLEIEWQAEIDKLLVSGIYLQNHCGDPHIIALKKLIFDHGDIFGANQERYSESSRLAEKFWQDFISTNIKGRNCLLEGDFRLLMQENYKKPMPLKKLFSSESEIIKAA